MAACATASWWSAATCTCPDGRCPRRRGAGRRQLCATPGAQQLGGVNYVSFGDWSRRDPASSPSVRFGEVGRWLGLAGTLARVSVLGVLMGMMLIVARAPVARVGRAALAEPLGRL